MWKMKKCLKLVICTVLMELQGKCPKITSVEDHLNIGPLNKANYMTVLMIEVKQATTNLQSSYYQQLA